MTGRGQVPAAAVAVLVVAAIAVLATCAAPSPVARHPPSTGSTPPTSRSRRPQATAIAVAPVAITVIGLVPVVAATATAFVAVRWSAIARRRAAQRRCQWALPDTLDLLILAVRAGLTPRQAVEVVAAIDGPCQPALAEVVHRTHRGQPFADALRALDEALGQWAAPSVDAIATCDRYGLSLEQLLEQLTADARATRQRLGQAAARRLPVKLSFPLVACTLPSFVLLAIVPAVLAALSSLQVPVW